MHMKELEKQLWSECSNCLCHINPLDKANTIELCDRNKIFGNAKSNFEALSYIYEIPLEKLTANIKLYYAVSGDTLSDEDDPVLTKINMMLCKICSPVFGEVYRAHTKLKQISAERNFISKAINHTNIRFGQNNMKRKVVEIDSLEDIKAEIDEDLINKNCDYIESEMAFPPLEDLMLPLPSAIKTVKYTKHDSNDTKRRKSVKEKCELKKTKTKENHERDSNTIIEVSDNEYYPPFHLSEENSFPLSPAGILPTVDPQMLEMTMTFPNHPPLSQSTSALSINIENEKSSNLQVANPPLEVMNKIANYVNDSDKKSVKSTQKRKPGRPQMDRDRFICQYCGKRFPQKCNFDVHVRTHTGERPHKCKICGKGFSHLGNVMKHEMTHDNDRFKGDPQFKCEICDRTFHLQGSLIDHRRLKHGPKKPKSHLSTKCEVCEAILPTRKAMLAHKRRRHSDKKVMKPYQCVKCMKCFLSDFALKFHENEHLVENQMNVPDEYKCAHCPTVPFKTLVSFTKENLLKHYAKEHSEISSKDVPLKKVYKCLKCPLKYSLKYEMIKHYSRVHENRKNDSVKKGSSSQTTSNKLPNRLSDSDTDSESEEDNSHGEKVKESHEKDSNMVSNEFSDNEDSPAPMFYEENSPQSSPVRISEDPQLLEMMPSNYVPTPSSECNPTLNINSDDGKPIPLQVSDLPIKEVIKPNVDCQTKSIFKSEEESETPFKKSKQFICHLCGKTFSQKCNFNSHARTHTGDKPYKCNICGKGFTHQGNVVRHQKTHNSTRFKGDPQFKCDICERKFYLQTTLTDHNRKKHGPKKSTTPASIKCELCHAIVSSAMHLKDHVKRLHTVSTIKPVKCPVCQLAFRDELYLQMHQATHTSENLLYQCTKCHRGYVKRSKLNWHFKRAHHLLALDYANHTAVKREEDCLVHDGRTITKLRIMKGKNKPVRKPEKDPDRLKCKICHKVSKLLQSHLIHMRSHTGEKPHKCRYCDKTFNDWGNRKKHEGTHDKNRLNGEPKYDCKICEKKYYLPQSLYHHNRIKHSSVLPKCYDKVKCDECGVEVRSKRALNTHKRNRHSEKSLTKPYQCLKCKVCFPSEDALKIHDKNHSFRSKIIEIDEYKCTHCPPTPFKPLVSFLKEDLIKHYAKKHPKVTSEDFIFKKLYKCPWCPQKCNRKSLLVRHNAKVHENRKGDSVKNKSNRQIKSKKRQTRLSDSESEAESEGYSSSSEEKITRKKSTDLQRETKSQKSMKSKLPVRKSTRVVKSKTELEDKSKTKSGDTNISQAFAHFNIKPLRIVLHKIDDIQNAVNYDVIDIKEEPADY